MTNKVLIKVLVPELDTSFDIFIPVNELIWRVKKLICKCISDLSNGNFDQNKDYIFIDVNTGQVYGENEIIINTNIRNSSELILKSI